MERPWIVRIVWASIVIVGVIILYLVFDYLIGTYSIGTQEIASLAITIFFVIMFGLFVYQTVRRKRYTVALVISLFFGVLGGVFAILSSSLVSVPISGDALLALQLNTYGFHILFFYIFLERLVSKSLKLWRFLIVMGCLLLQTFSLWFIVWFNQIPSGDASIILWYFADLGYIVLAFFGYGFGVYVYIKTFLYTHEIKPIIFSVVMLLTIAGFIVSALVDFVPIFVSPKPDWLTDIAPLGLVLQAFGLILFTVTYLTNIDYLYRLPNDIFLLMVTTTAGIPLHSVKFRTHREGQIEEDLLSGMLSAINSVFSEVFKEDSSIRNISSEGISVLMEPGNEKQILALVITDKISYFLDKALKRYAKAFEKHFSQELAERIQDTVAYADAINLIKPIFPFFIIETDLKV